MLGAPRRHFQTVDSTNRVARELAAAGAPHGTLVTASQQSAGRGRQGRPWSAPPGRALLMSLVMRSPSRLLSLTAGVASAEAVEAATGLTDVCLKWPNDVMIEGRKVCGILVEGRPQEHWAVLGIGLNVALRLEDFPEELRHRATTLGLWPEDVERVLAVLLDKLEQALQVTDAEILEALSERDYLRGRKITWQTPVGVESGTAVGIDRSGGLKVELADGTSTVLDAGEVHIGAL